MPIFRRVLLTQVYGNASDPPRSGEIASPDGVWPASSGVRAFDLDFGRIAVLVCFDINFAELWLQAEGLGADLVVWPSAMATPDPSTLVRRLHHSSSNPRLHYRST